MSIARIFAKLLVRQYRRCSFDLSAKPKIMKTMQNAVQIFDDIMINTENGMTNEFENDWDRIKIDFQVSLQLMQC